MATLADLIATFRTRADDRAVPQLWSDAEITGLANEAESEAAERSRCLKDSTTPAVCQVVLVPDQQEYPLDARVIDVADCRVRGIRGALGRAADEVVLYHCPHAPGIPQRYALYQTGAGLVLVLDRPAPDPDALPVPGYGGKLDLTVYRRPLNQLVDPEDVPEIPAPRHTDLIHGMLARAYETRDADASDTSRAATHEARFTLAFGEKIDANVRRKQLRHRPPVVKPAHF